MKKKFVIKDESGMQYDVEEMDIEKAQDTPTEPAPASTPADNEGLSASEIVALKKLAAVADQLAGLISDNANKPTEKTDADPEVALDAEENEEEENEKVVDTTKAKSKDAKSSIGTIDTSKAKIDDSIAEDEISAAWAKRFNGGK